MSKYTGAEVIQTNGHQSPVLCLFRGDDRYPVAAASWHVDYDNFITCPPTQDSRHGIAGDLHRHDWLAEVVGQFSIDGNASKTAISAWLEAADLSPLLDKDDHAGHKALCDSLATAVAQLV